MGRKTTAEIFNDHMARGDATGWFEEVYRSAAGDEAHISWADMKPHLLLASWLDGQQFAPLRTLDIGCGLGDNAEALAAAGMQVCAIDISPTAIEWVKKRFPASQVDYRAVDLLAMTDDWQARFEFINEIYTLQALPDSLRPKAIAAIAALLAPGGTLHLVCRGRSEDEVSDGPPWALSESEIMAFESHRLKCRSFERFDAYDDSNWPRFRFVFNKYE